MPSFKDFWKVWAFWVPISPAPPGCARPFADMSPESRPWPAISRAPKGHINIRIKQYFWYPHYIGPWNQNVRSFCLCGLLGPEASLGQTLSKGLCWFTGLSRGCLGIQWVYQDYLWVIQGHGIRGPFKGSQEVYMILSKGQHLFEGSDTTARL